MSENKKMENIAEKKVSRRSMLKWTGGLAGAAIVGAIAEYGAGQLMKAPPPPPPPNFKPPLSPDVQQRVDAIVKDLVGMHQDETIVPFICNQNGCWQRCLNRAHVKSGIVTAIETDDSIHAGMAREDVGDEVLRQGMVQMRACVRGRGWRKALYDPDRALYPMKNTGKRGERKFVRISWDEALSTVASKMVEFKDKYGPYFMASESFSPWAGFGYGTWGLSSWSGTDLGELVTYGYDGIAAFRTGVNRQGSCPVDFLNTKLIIMWGWNPALNQFETAFWITLAKEKGVKIIVVDPYYSVSAEAYADQWIPIRPSTDAAMLLAMANVMFKEDIYDKTFVGKFVEPEGFAKWKDYVLGVTEGPDGKIDRTPEWAETICGVPAETIKGLAELVASTKPSFFKFHYVPARQTYNDNQARAGMYIPVMTGNVGISGTFYGGSGFGNKNIGSIPVPNYKRAASTYTVPTLQYTRGWYDEVLLRDKMQNKEITEDDYRRRIGCAASWPLPNTHMADRTNSVLSSDNDLNKAIRALQKLDFVVVRAWFNNQPSTYLADIVLPNALDFFEVEGGGRAGFNDSSGSGFPLNNYFIYAPKVVNPPGEARPSLWTNLSIASRLGIGRSYMSTVADLPYEQFDNALRGIYQQAYNAWAASDAVAPLKPLGWEDFLKNPIFRVPIQTPFAGFKEEIQGGKAFGTPSGKIEFYSETLADTEFGRKSFFNRCFGGSVPPIIPPMAEWVPAWDGMYGKNAIKYPLYCLSPHSYFKQHSTQDNNPWFLDECRHACQISVADANARGIKDGDLVRVYNDLGEMILPAYVTSRQTPGVVYVRFGAYYKPSQTKTSLMPYGIDMRGAQNFLTNSELYPWVLGPTVSSGDVQVEKFMEVA
jgi:anaerobic dimethyl sulfoxide reductase subunit A